MFPHKGHTPTKGSLMYDRIVVGTDGSTQALGAVRVAGKLAKLCGLSEVHVVAACVPLSPGEIARIESDLPDEFHDLVSPHLTALDRIEHASTELLESGIQTVRHESGDQPATAILAAAESIDADLIVVGARGIGPIDRFLRGSVSTKVAHHAPCDVLIVEHN
jgi:nucleotide-binding universal stress UspA family protein